MAAKALVNIGGKATAKVFIEILEDGDVSMREIAANYLGDLNEISAISALVAGQYDNNESVRKASIKSLKKLGYHKNKKMKEPF